MFEINGKYTKAIVYNDNIEQEAIARNINGDMKQQIQNASTIKLKKVKK